MFESQFFTLLVYAIAGMVGAFNMVLWGIYGDLLVENFEWKKVLRTLLLGSFYGIYLWFLNPELPFLIVALVCITLERITTEIYKIFLREENQDKYEINSDLGLHLPLLLKRIIGVFLIFSMLFLLQTVSIHTVSIITIVFVGLVCHFGEVIKKVHFQKEIFYAKFFRAPIITLLFAYYLFVTFPSLEGTYFILALIGGERIIGEFYDKILTESLPYKFKKTKKINKTWYKQRDLILIVYVMNIISLLLLQGLATIKAPPYFLLVSTCIGIAASIFIAGKEDGSQGRGHSIYFKSGEYIIRFHHWLMFGVVLTLLMSYVLTSNPFFMYFSLAFLAIAGPVLLKKSGLQKSLLHWFVILLIICAFIIIMTTDAYYLILLLSGICIGSILQGIKYKDWTHVVTHQNYR